MQNPHFGSKLKIPKNMSKSSSTNHLQLFLCKKPLQKNTKYSRNESVLKIGHHACKGYRPCKILTLVVLRKSRSKNTKYLRNESILKIGHHAHKGYSPCKIVSLAQKLRFEKTYQNPCYKPFTVVLCKKPLQKTLNIREMRAF